MTMVLNPSTDQSSAEGGSEEGAGKLTEGRGEGVGQRNPVLWAQKRYVREVGTLGQAVANA